MLGFKATTITDLHLHTNIMSILSCQQAAVKYNGDHNGLHESTCIQLEP